MAGGKHDRRISVIIATPAGPPIPMPGARGEQPGGIEDELEDEPKGGDTMTGGAGPSGTDVGGGLIGGGASPSSSPVSCALAPGGSLPFRSAALILALLLAAPGARLAAARIARDRRPSSSR